MTRYLLVVSSNPISGCRYFLEQEKLPPLPLMVLLVDSRNEFERDFTIELNKPRGLRKK